MRRLCLLAVAVWSLIGSVPAATALSARAAAAPAATTQGSPYTDGRRTRDGIGKYYMGREIAQVMGHTGAGWLERAERDAEERPNLVIESMELKPGDVVADIGAGTGYFTFRIAPNVPRGKVLAVDIQPEMLEQLEAREAELGLSNVEPVLGTIDDPRLPAGSVDMALMVDAYHEFSHPREMGRAIFEALKPGGRVMLVEYRAEDPAVAIKPLHKMSERQAIAEMGAAGLAHVRTIAELPRQHLMIFQKPAEPVGWRGMEADHPGASAAFTTSDPIVKQALALLGEGKFKEAQSLLASDDGHADDNVQAAREESKEIIRRIRRDYSASAGDIVAKLKREIPDVTEADLERWRQAGEAQYRVVDGEVKYFRREPANIFRFSAEAKRRRDAHAKPDEPAADRWTLHNHLANVIAEAERSGKTEVLPIRHRMKHTVTIAANRPDAKSGALVRCWLPFPQEYRQQKDVKLVESSSDPLVAPNGIAQRTVYFEKRIDDPAQPIEFNVTFEYLSYAYYPVLKDELVQPLPADWDGAFLGERPPHIVFTPELKAKVSEIVGDETNALARARRIFHWIDSNIRYHAEQEYSTLPSFSGLCLTRGRGDCGVQTMLFMTMARIAGIPTRWQSGWESKRDRWSMHDWAEMYIEPWGWLPVDQSYGVQKSDDPRIRDFYLGHQDSYRMIGNLDYGAPLHPPKISLRSEPADFQVGEIEIDGRNLFYDEWSYDMKIEWLTDEK